MTNSPALTAFVRHISVLADRWDDEKEYEDFDDYIANVMKACTDKNDLTFVAMTEWPFKVTVKEGSTMKHVIHVTAKGITVKTYTTAAPAAQTTKSKTQTTEKGITMNAKTLSAMSLTELAAVYNTHAAKPVKKFSCSKEAAVAKVLSVLPAKPKAAKGTSTKKQGIGTRTVELLKAGGKPTDVLAQLRKEFAAEVSSMASVYWYSSKIKTGEIA